MRALSLCLSILSITIFTCLYLHADDLQLLHYNNMITQRLLHQQLGTATNTTGASSSKVAQSTFMLRGNKTKVVHLGSNFTVTQKHLLPKSKPDEKQTILTFERSFMLAGDIRRAWAHDCQSIEVLAKEGETFKPYTYRVCYLLDLETLNPDQWNLIKRSEDIIMQNLTPTITSHDDYQMYKTLPQALQPLFIVASGLTPKPAELQPLCTVSPELIPKPAELSSSKMVTLATIASLLLGGYITIF